MIIKNKEKIRKKKVAGTCATGGCPFCGGNCLLRGGGSAL
jgi:hypothetical protein